MATGEEGQVENIKDEHYAAMPKSWQSRNNMEMNKAMGYNNMADPANTPHPATEMKGETRDTQSGTKLPGKNEYNYEKMNR